MLIEVADGVWTRQSAWMWTNSTVLRTDAGLVVVDPGIDGAELDALADDVAALGAPVVAGFSTHPHWDHLLWHARLGDVPRYATATAARIAEERRDPGRAMAAESAAGVPLELLGLLTAVPEDGGGLPGERIEHDAHARGHAALLLADRGALVAGDLLSDVLVPMLDPRQDGQHDAYRAVLDRIEAVLDRVDVLVPGHGSVARGAEIRKRLDVDRAYVEALQRGEQPEDDRFGPRG